MKKFDEKTRLKIILSFLKAMADTTHMTGLDGETPYVNQFVDKCIYVIKSSSNKAKDPSSLSSLVDTYQLSQSDCIKIGLGLENVLRDLIIGSSLVIKNIKPVNSKGEHEKDHLFLNTHTNTIYYAEIKSNLNLDTEKSVKTYSKCQTIEQQLKEKYPDCTVKMFLVGGRYFSKSEIPPYIYHKYTTIKDNLVGINEYLSSLGIIHQFTAETYKDFINYLSQKMFKY